MKQKFKKGFTIVELVIVIAVIGILSAVLIPTFSGLINEAHLKSDNVLVRNINERLALEESKNGKNETMHEALEDAKLAGYLVANINATSKDNQLVWDQTLDRFALISTTDGSVIAGEVADINKKFALWKIANSYENNGGYSIYLNDNYNGNGKLQNINAGVDLGNNIGITEISYVNVEPSNPQTVIIRTNGAGTVLTVNAPLDTVHHYDYLEELTVTSVAPSSYHEHGTVRGKTSIAEGRLVIENEGELSSVEITSKDNDIKIETNKDIAVSASPSVVEALGSDKLSNVELKVTSASAQVVVDEKVDSSKVEAAGKSSEDLISITKVSTIDELINAVGLNSDAKYIQLTRSLTNEKGNLVNVLHSCVIDGNGFTISGYGAKRGTTSNYNHIVINESGNVMVDVLIKNLNIISSAAGGNTNRPLETRGNINSLTLENVNITCQKTGNNQAICIGGTQTSLSKLVFKNVQVFASRSGYPVITFNPIDVKVDDSYFDGYCGFYLQGIASDSKIVANNTLFNSPNSYSIDGSNSFGVFALQNYVSNIEITLNDCKVNNAESNTAYQALISFNYTDPNKRYENVTLTINEGCYINGLLSLNGGGVVTENSKIIINGGEFVYNPLSEDSYVYMCIAELGNNKTIKPTSNFTYVVA